MRELLLQDFFRFCVLQLESRDVDPVYPVLAQLEKTMEPEQALWHTLLYVGYYSLASATMAFSQVPFIDYLPTGVENLPTGVERRGFRDGSLRKHVVSLLLLRKQYGSLQAWLKRGFGADTHLNWHILQNNIRLAWGNGRWAGYKTAEILSTVQQYPVSPTDMGNAFSSGPRQGLALFYGEVMGNTHAAIRLLDEQGDHLLTLTRKQGIDLDIAQLETMLCDFHALAEGRYYVGHDIDQMQEQLIKSALPPSLQEPLWHARKMTLPHHYLGEFGGWNGVQKERKKWYQQHREVVFRG